MTDTSTAELAAHGQVVRNLAGEMFRAALWVALAVIAICAGVWAIVAGMPGLLSSLLGGAIACASAIITLGVMRKTALLPVHIIMVAALGGFLAKLIILLGVMLVVREVPAVHANALAITMVATIVVTTFFEARASKRSRSQMVIPAAESSSLPN